MGADATEMTPLLFLAMVLYVVCVLVVGFADVV